MLASGPAVLSAMLALQGAAELEAGARIEARAGEVPAMAGPTGTAGQAQVMLIATPILGLRWSGDASEARASSATRIFWLPVPLLESRPLFLETLDTSFLARPNRRSRFQLNLRGSYGEEDYTLLAQQFVGQPTLPPVRTLTLLTLNAAGDGSWRESRRTTLTVLLAAIHRRTPDHQVVNIAGAAGTTPGLSLPALPTQTLITATPGVRYALDRRSSLEALLGLGETDIQGFQLGNSSARMNVLTIQPQLGLVRDLSRSQQVRAVAGLTYAAVLINPDKQRNWLPLTPLCRVELGSLLWRTRASALRSSLGAGTAWYADPVLGAAVLHGMTEARLEAQLGLRWSAAARAAFTTDLNAPLPASGTGGVSPDETVVLVEVPFRYRWSTQLDVEFGARYAERAPNLAAADFGWHNRELWAFVTLLTTTSRPSRPRS
jgi:hypothetical protein